MSPTLSCKKKNFFKKDFFRFSFQELFPGVFLNFFQHLWKKLNVTGNTIKTPYILFYHFFSMFFGKTEIHKNSKKINDNTFKSNLTNIYRRKYLKNINLFSFRFAGILIEILTSSASDSFLRSQDSQEMLVYCFYMLATFCECASILTPKIDRKAFLTSYAVASLLESYVAYHFIENRQNRDAWFSYKTKEKFSLFCGLFSRFLAF